MRFSLRGHFVCLLVLFTFSLMAQRGKYRSPVNHGITLAGSFGELRSSHFHAGIDIRPSGKKTADTIYAVADGFLSRVKTQRGGFGRAIYIDHADGNTSVYAHLSYLFDPISSLVYKEQMRLESYEVDIYPEKSSVKIKKGQAIGLMGNAGNSYGAHLHFEIRETVSEVPINPFLYGIKSVDKIKPTISSIGLHGLHASWSDSYYTNIGNGFNKDGSASPQYAVPAWRVGLSVQGFDQMNGAPNKNGYYAIKLFVDDTLYFHSTMDSVSYEEGDLIDCYIDYPLQERVNRKEALLYRLPANTVRTIKYAKNEGAFQIFASKPRNICIKLEDFEGNVSSAYFSIIRDTLMVGNRQIPTYEKALKQNVDESFALGDFQFKMLAGTLAKDGGMNVSGYGKSYKVGDGEQAILKDFEYCVIIPEELAQEKDLFFANVSSSKPAVKGGVIKDGKYCGTMSAFGNYRFIKDNEAPVILPVSFSTNATAKSNFTFKLSDNVSYRTPARTFEYKVFIDDVFIPSEMKELTGVLTVPLGKLTKGSHQLVIKVRDSAKNEAEFSKLFNK